jgi:LacI family transcriptional regulator
MKQRATVEGLARQLGVSVATVSRALNGHSYVSEKTRQRVLDAARDSGFQPNALARALRREQTELVALVIPDVRSEFFASATSVLQAALEARGYRMILGVTGDDARRDHEYLEAMVRQRVDGIIHTPCTPNGADVLEKVANAPPVVEFTRRSRGSHADSVVGEDRKGVAALTRHLVELGHRRIAAIAGNPAASTTRERLASFRRTASDGGLDGDDVIVEGGEYSAECGYQVTTRLLAADRPPTAIFASNTQLAAGALQATSEAGVRIPRDLSVVCYDDPIWYRACNPAITTYSVPLDRMGALAVDLLLDRMAESDEPARPRHRRVAGRLLLRGSTAPPRADARLEARGRKPSAAPVPG